MYYAIIIMILKVSLFVTRSWFHIDDREFEIYNNI